jgi:hypothetical protein
LMHAYALWLVAGRYDKDVVQLCREFRARSSDFSSSVRQSAE